MPDSLFGEATPRNWRIVCNSSWQMQPCVKRQERRQSAVFASIISGARLLRRLNEFTSKPWAGI